MDSIKLRGTHQAYIHTYFLIAQDCECDKKTEKTYLDGSAFVMVILQAKHAGVTVTRRYMRSEDWMHMSSKSIQQHLEGIGGQSVGKHFLENYEAETFENNSQCR